jgi:methyltransferase-like protein/2-polyprenyl-3-methyl-5-hydroxy-6-metoxy-1,4-benzoquinol methylase
MPTKSTIYDKIPYESNPFRQSHPDRLSSIASLFGLGTPALDDCRVLELGCSMGNNLLPIAQRYPGARCLGIDSSKHQIEVANQSLKALQFENIEFRCADILDLDDDIGEFDYIISHGVFSWVPEPVQDKLLQLCRQLLSPTGVAYISYNTYPGWHMRGIIRDMMLYRGTRFSDPGTKLEQAKALVKFVAEAAHGEDSPYRQYLQGELEQLTRMQDYYVHHEHLEEHNTPIYFHQFVDRLAQNRLRFLGEAKFASMVASNFNVDIARTLHNIGAHDLVQMEQYMDFIRCRYFRESIVCHQDIVPDRNISPLVVEAFYLGSDAVVQGEDWSLAHDSLVTFSSRSGSQIQCRSPVTKLALLRMRELWPLPVAFEELLAHVVSASTEKGYRVEEASVREFLAREMFSLLASGAIEWSVADTPLTIEVADKPLATPLARLQADHGPRVTTLRSEVQLLDELTRNTLRFLDGAHDASGIVDELLELFRGGELVMQRGKDESEITDEDEIRKLLAREVERILPRLARQALLQRTE